MSAPGFDEFFRAATGFPPYPYQRKLALEGLPDVIDVETGAGKTAGSILGWLWRRTRHPDDGVRRTTPRWCVYASPLRSLTEQTTDAVRHWIESLQQRSLLAEGEVAVHTLMGGHGRPSVQDAWRLEPEQTSIIIGTIDMLLSRALNRGYAMSRYLWPVDFGLYNNGCQWIFDEVQLMGAALATSRQLDGLRERLGTLLPCQSTWMSATLANANFSTIDARPVRRVVRLSAEDTSTPALSRRASATKIVREVQTARDRRAPERLAEVLLEQHRAGTLSLAVLNTVERARELTEALRRRRPAARVVLLHSRFRPADRRRHLRDALSPGALEGAGTIVVATQVIEAGVDCSARLLLTEAAPWSSIVQRLGRCNRDGTHEDAAVLWTVPRDAAPYSPEAIDDAVSALRSFEGQMITPTSARSRSGWRQESSWPTLRRADLVGLFDTTPDVSGHDLDIAAFIRAEDDLDALLGWRPLGGRPSPDEPPLRTEELCAVPVSRDLRQFVTDHRGRVWRFDPIASGWVRALPSDLRPGATFLIDADAGGYDPEIGWSSAISTAVPPVPEPSSDLDPDATASLSGVGESEGAGEDPLSALGAWVTLVDHLRETADEASALVAHFGLDSHLAQAVVEAARLHDLGKAHPVFQHSLARVGEQASSPPPPGGPYAKSGTTGRLRHERPAFRHELASALALLQRADLLSEPSVSTDLVAYLVAAHHGRIRLGIRSSPQDAPEYVLGIAEGDELPPAAVPGSAFTGIRLLLEPVRLGRSATGEPSWTERMLALRDRTDLGPFRLAFLEALVRIADFRASGLHRSMTSPPRGAGGAFPSTSEDVTQAAAGERTTWHDQEEGH